MKNTFKTIISSALVLAVSASMCACTFVGTPVMTKTEPDNTIPAVTTEFVAEEIMPVSSVEEEIVEEEPRDYIADLCGYYSENNISASSVDLRENIVEEPVISIFGNSFNGKVVTSQKELYLAAFNAAIKGETTMDITIAGNVTPITSKMFDYMPGVHSYTWDIEGANYRYHFTYYPGARVEIAYKNGTTQYLSSADKKLYEEGKRIVALCTSPSRSDYQNAKALHDYLAKNVTYDHTYRNRTANGALFDGTTVCSGYADAYNMLLTLAGIESYSISGTASSGGRTAGHGWNLVKLDGRWVYVDVTWDDTDFPSKTDYVEYTYFAISEEELAQRNHFWDKEVTNLLKHLS